MQDDVKRSPHFSAVVVFLPSRPAMVPLLWEIWQTVKKAAMLFR
ncbi:MAG TPA: hypothetical protein VFH26_06430 [Gemmatimonadales bacterium]|nr:hypothetical protein [Gemmatimonadales bacterium]